MYVCVCKGVRFSDVIEAARFRGAAPEDLIEAFGFDDSDSCGRCVTQITKLSLMVRLKLDEPRSALAIAQTGSNRG